ncbi:sugar phosphate isomerase/epimerase family protein [Lacticaseibacillus jixiensis]|uniref:sugar phosphate isomerase/epimerase family protein n=1 Tax=Lacticaseibacillus jixiensis TaxID=3231926 RepID=UPI0036F26A1F
MTINLGYRAHDAQPHTLEHLLGVCQRYQLNNIQFAPFKFLPSTQFPDMTAVTPGLADTLRKRFANAGVTVSILGCYVNISSPDAAVQEAALQRFYDTLALANRFGATVVATETGTASPNGFTLANYTEEAYVRMRDAVREMTATAAQFGVTVAIEPGVNHPLHDNVTVARLLRDVDSPNLRVLFDLANILSHDNMADQAAVLEEAQSLYGDKIVAFHLKDFKFTGDSDGQKQYMPVGSGVVDIPAYVRFINRLKPYTYATFEGVSEADLPTAVKLVRQVDSEFPDVLA